jgi:hypothetical protein
MLVGVLVCWCVGVFFVCVGGLFLSDVRSDCLCGVTNYQEQKVFGVCVYVLLLRADGFWEGANCFRLLFCARDCSCHGCGCVSVLVLCRLRYNNLK